MPEKAISVLVKLYVRRYEFPLLLACTEAPHACSSCVVGVVQQVYTALQPTSMLLHHKLHRCGETVFFMHMHAHAFLCNAGLGALPWAFLHPQP